MDQLDREIREIVQQGFSEVKLTKEQKSLLQQSLQSELLRNESVRKQKNWWGNLRLWLSEFWEATFEINLTPIVATVVVIIVAFGALNLNLQRYYNSSDAGVVYVQQTMMGPDGISRTVYIPVKGGEADASNKT